MNNLENNIDKMVSKILAEEIEKKSKQISEQLEEDLTSFEETLYTDDYKEVGLLPPTPNYKGILSW